MTTATAIEYPAFYQAVSRSSAEGQRLYMRSVRVRLTALVLSAVGGALTWKIGAFEPFAWLALVGFVVALAAEFVILALHPDQKWYEGRAAAESAKTLTWRYAVGGDPFPPGGPRADADFRAQLQEITRDLTVLPTPDERGGERITPAMRALRAQAFAVRRDAYVEGRIRDQRSWYARKSQQAARLNTLFLLLTVVLEFVGVVAAALRVAGYIEFDLLGILAALTGSVAAWAQTRQWGSVARAYAIAENELSAIGEQAGDITEAAWPRFVDESEEAISREHTLWRSSRGVLHRRVPDTAVGPAHPDTAPRVP